MENCSHIYQDIATRTQGDIYIGVVGPVRTGKSTFIKRFMDIMVLPRMENDFKRERAIDELPQSSGGRTIMTTEPKFIPNEAVEISVGDSASFRMRMIDCVGYIVDSANGYMEDDQPRMVMSPWSDMPIPFVEAAEIGTRKVIAEHSTVGIVITCDGSITDIDGEDYRDAEKRVIRELSELNKPFVVVLNSTHPTMPQTVSYAEELSNAYHVPVIPLNCLEMTESDIDALMQQILYEFPLREVTIDLPRWLLALDEDASLYAEISDAVFHASENVQTISDIMRLPDRLKDNDTITTAEISNISAGDGVVSVQILLPEELFYQTVKEQTGFDIADRKELLLLMRELSLVKQEYEKIADALTEVKQKGYGIVTPSKDELSLEEPEMVKQGSRFGVRLRASAPSIHMIRADIETEVSPIVGTERQSEELVHYLLHEFENDPKKIWETNIFGKSLHELVNEGLHNKLYRMPDDARMKLQETLQKIINEGSGGMICIIL